jgi:hypothetical protein
MALAALPGLLVFGHAHTDSAIWVTMPVAWFVAYGSVLWFPIAIVIAVRRFRAGTIPATREFVQLFLLGIVAVHFIQLMATDGLH